ncbi:p21-activated protein kinase-interacting protein 1-like [Limanda limanda]|uniref:p21-activated protein kinase-interacting protein 1-like n=1 Tax=Limanda limanda TaxID=27771 RepID=UPI0029C7BB44|nr:p21-activated protein kinase-interacting protein 1-like [Limanda limanda]
MSFAHCGEDERFTSCVRQAMLTFIKNIEQTAHIVWWSPDGDKYVVVVDDEVNIYDLETASVRGTITNPKRISSCLNNSLESFQRPREFELRRK